MELLYFFKILYRKKWLILGCTLVAIITSFLLTMNQGKQYKSVAQLSTGFTMSEEMRLSDERFNSQQIDVKFSNVIENINSIKVLQLLSYDLMLHDLTDKKPFKVLNEKQKESSDYKNVNINQAVAVFKQKLAAMQMLDPSIPEEQKITNLSDLYGYSVDWLHDNLNVNRFERSDYIYITFTSENPELSAFVVNNLIAQFDRYYSQDKRARSDSSLIGLDSLVQQKKRIMDEKIAAKSNYMSSQGIVDVGMEGGSKLQQISNFESQLAEEKGNQQNLTFRVQQLTNLINDAHTKGVSNISGEKINTADNNEYVVLKKQYNDLYRDYIQKGSNDPEIKKRLDQLSESMRKLSLSTDADVSEVTGTNKSITVDELIQKKLDSEGLLRASIAKSTALQARINELYGGLTGMAAKGAGIDKLDKEIQIASAEYTSAKDKLNLVSNLSEGSSSFKQTLYGQPAITPEPSRRWLIVALAAVATFVLSSMVILLIEYFDQSIKTPSQFQRLTYLPLLGSVNFIKLNGDILGTVNHSNENDTNRENTFRELLRKLRFEIENSGKKIFLFTSTESGQGKTTLIQALAYSLSLGKKRVLIIDTNFCNNDLTKSFSAKPMLEKFSINGKPFEIKDINGLITKSVVDGVDMIGCSEGDYTPSEILPKNHLLNHLPEILKVYDFIFLEGAPLNNYTDTKELIHYSDAVVAVFSSESILSASDKESIKFLRQNKEKFLGAILNKVPEENLNL
ncbi:MAG: exopolysaccharide transport family protein [Ginsengibacter sp.]